ncbi:two-component sensor histidine kinase [Plantibacter flavus]|uniref:sensor histidine kinase n=1 Tax=Plantibacter TaxID=190323 RepID=UPI0010C1ED2B|nr:MULTISPECIES: histidine kinase [Plantibacter]MBD8103949.1 two-component sensor histidine kinase [Plantibacter sp. CFBP 8775]MBD8467396.1 two-component sensor histidine kinase [Plantibacter sp. CFBP 8798]TKJ96857.1 two-component sensor histidine kinase [Plantibacter flavus]
MRHPKKLAIVVDLALLTAAFVEGLTTFEWASPVESWIAVAAAAGLLVRRRWPWVSLLLASPAFALGLGAFAGLIALYSVACRERRSWALTLAGLIVFTVTSAPWRGLPPPQYAIIVLAYALLYAGGPIALGLLTRTRVELTARLADLNASREIEQRRLTTEILREERVHIAREMHDVVSHQVSLIAVQAGALQVSTPDEATRHALKNIRLLAVRTLDELRAMVSLLRAEDSSQPVTPQPTTADLYDLIANSGTPVEMVMDLQDDLPQPIQRAVYRTIQEGLTNVRKHAPGAIAHIRADATKNVVSVSIQNQLTLPVHTDASLPGGHGLMGLQERAELLGGTLAVVTDTETFTLALRLPR